MQKIESKLNSLKKIEDFSSENLSQICEGTDFRIYGYTRLESDDLINVSFLLDVFYMDDLIDFYGFQFAFFHEQESKIKNFYFDKKSGQVIPQIKLFNLFDKNPKLSVFVKCEKVLNEDKQAKSLLEKDIGFKKEKSDSDDSENEQDDDELSMVLFKKGKKLYKDQKYRDAMKRFNMAYYKCSVGCKNEYLYLWWWAACLYQMKDFDRAVIIYFKALHRMDNEEDIELCKRQIESAMRKKEKRLAKLKLNNIFGLEF
ncbi:unnamed protein product [Brachionus calyciflorus]|uniref:Tetratricopeptide repeat protein n=1 Tax=Brachionus calyciflorus TaxID=104777 RepID=A0A813YKP7_9BILA|nr:unnamed protein product [Brachionus calyciflorus]